jgi:NAD(P)H-dependent FMN reductase
MSNVLVVIGSARKGRVADKILGYIQKDIESRVGVTAVIADLKEINMPFFDNENSPASPDYAPTDQHVLAFQRMVAESDSVVFITPEYNHTLSAVQKNALDSIYAEWNNKPTAVVAYGWSGGSQSVTALSDILPHIKAVFNPETAAKLVFMKDINVDGTIIDESSVSAQIKIAIDSVA